MRLFALLFFFTLKLHAATVLVIGDSHVVGPFGQTLDQLLREAQLEVATYGSCGSIPKWWTNGKMTTCGYFAKDLTGKTTLTTKGKTPLLPHLLELTRPDMVVMEFGTNYVHTTNDDSVKKDIQNIVSMVRASGAKCFWVTHPDSRLFREQLPRLTRLIHEAAGADCFIFESQKHTSYPASGGDGIHYWGTQGTPIAKEWARKVTEGLLPIL